MLDLIFILVCLIALVNTNSSIVRKFGLPAKYELQLHYLLAYHLLFSLVFTWYIINFGGDSKGYWLIDTMEQVKIIDPTWDKYFGPSTTFILWLTYVPSKIIGFEYITGNLLFGFLGFIGIRYLVIMTASYFPTNHSVLNIPLFPAIFYFPNLHFWTAGVGKDALCFWGIAWFLFAVQSYRKRWWQGAIALFFVYMARPHMGQALVAGAAIAILLGSEIKREYKIGLGISALAGSIYLSASTLQFLHIEEFSIEAMGALADKTSGLLNSEKVGSGVNISTYSFPMRIFTYLFRPLFFDAHNIISFLSSFENLFYLYLSFFIYRNWTPEAIRKMPVFLKAGIIVFIPTMVAFANSLGNLGAIMRMKNMTMIYFLLFCFFLISYNKQLRIQKAEEKIRYYRQREELKARKSRRNAG